MSVDIRKVFATFVAILIFHSFVLVDVISNCRLVLYPFFLGLLFMEGILH